MAATVFTIKTGDTQPALVATLTDNGTAIDLATATSVEFVAKGNTTSTIITGACTITNATQGVVTYQWATDDTANADTYQVEFMITWPNGKQTVPGVYADNPTFEIDARLDGATG